MSVFPDGSPKIQEYPFMNEYTTFLHVMNRPLVGREKELNQLMAAMLKPIYCNVILLGEAGSGKTALVQGAMTADRDRAYLEVDLPKMISNLKNENEMADKLKRLFFEVGKFRTEENKEIVLFIDEFHQIVQLSSAAVEVLKPLLADSGTRGIRVIAATTYIEYQQYIASNLPLVERLQRINLAEPKKDVVVSILRSIADTYGVGNQFKNNSMFEAIYEYTNRYIPANAQPRKSILMLDNMVGWSRLTHKPIDMKMLADVIYQTEGINIAISYNPHKVREQLDSVVFAQQAATKCIATRLQICCADMNNKNKPMSSFLFAGSTGVGKGLVNDTLIPVYTEDGSVSVKRNGDLVPGDKVFNRKGEPVSITDVFPRGMQDIYEVTLTDGRKLYTDESHLWSYVAFKGKYTDSIVTSSTKEMYEKGVTAQDSLGRQSLVYWLPMNGPVQYPEANLEVDPYVMGAFISGGCMTVKQLTLSSEYKEVAKECASVFGDCISRRVNRDNISWVFPFRRPIGKVKLRQMVDTFGAYPEVCGKKACDKRIPSAYLTASVDQRWRLVQGIFDISGTIGDAANGRHIISYVTTSKGLVDDIRTLLYSLGIASSVSIARKSGSYVQYRITVKCRNKDKVKFFTVSDKKALADVSSEKSDGRKSRSKDYDLVGIESIMKMPYQKETTCIYVDDEEHLYQAGEYVVTHNTEMTKQLAQILFESDRSLIRMDMTEYARPDSMERFRAELTAHVWEHPFSIVLLDEIEKSCPEVTRLLLQVLDDGRLIDRHNREVTFKNCYIIVTTNAGSKTFKDIAQYESSDTGDSKAMEHYDGLIRSALLSEGGGGKFPAELLGRIDCLVPFQPLSRETMRKICTAKLNKIKDEVYSKYSLTLYFDKNLIDYVTREKMTTDSDAGGARAVVSRVEKEILSEVSTFINDLRRASPGERIPEGLQAYVYVVGKMAITDKTMKESDAYVTVSLHAPVTVPEKDYYAPPQAMDLASVARKGSTSINV